MPGRDEAIVSEPWAQLAGHRDRELNGDFVCFANPGTDIQVPSVNEGQGNLNLLQAWIDHREAVRETAAQRCHPPNRKPPTR